MINSKFLNEKDVCCMCSVINEYRVCDSSILLRRIVTNYIRLIISRKCKLSLFKVLSLVSFENLKQLTHGQHHSPEQIKTSQNNISFMESYTNIYEQRSRIPNLAKKKEDFNIFIQILCKY